VSDQNSGFRQFITAVFDRYKCKNPGDPWIHLPVRDGEGKLIAYMKPIIREFRLVAPYLPELLTRWRVENPTISTGKFTASPERTATWLDNLVVGRDDRLIFMLEGLDGTPLGHLGYSNFHFEEETGEIDSVLRGVKSGHPGLMTLATRALLAWGYRELKLKEITLSVYSDNESAVRFYERLGFVKTIVKPLYTVHLPGEEKLELAPPGYAGPVAKYYVYMKYRGDRAGAAPR
jgi:RimJ/RimL family protein N-acetyltransferase